MAFLLLAASARDDAALMLEQHRRKRQEEQRRQQLGVEEEQRDEEEEDTCHSLPCSWKASSVNVRRTPKPHKSWKTYFRSRLPTRSYSTRDGFSEKTTWRQRRRIRQAANEVQAVVEARLQEAPFLTCCSQLEDDNLNEQDSIHSAESFPSQEKEENAASNQLLLDLTIVARNDLNIRQWLGRGGFNDVWEVAPLDSSANNSSNNKLVFKHLKSSLLPHPHSLLSHSHLQHHHHHHHRHSRSSDFVLGAIDLRMEALYLSQMSHPNIIHLHGVVQPKHGLPYGDGRYDGFGLLLEPLSDSLDNRLDDWRRLPNKPDLAKILDYAAQIANAVQYLHDRRIVLCDLKPSNVGFAKDDTDTIKLFDFGLVHELPAFGEEEDPYRLYPHPDAGTPTYLPPEVIVEGKYNCFMDVYSWAMVLYEMVTLCPPYPGLSRSELYQRVAVGGERPSLAVGVPEELQSLLQHAWEANVKQRWSMGQVVEELDRIRGRLGLVLGKTPSTTDEVKVKRPHHRRKSSVKSLLYGREGSLEDSALIHKDEMEKEQSGVSMTADDFERIFEAGHHRRE